MKLGAVVRIDTARGVGSQTTAFAQHMLPDRLLVIDARKAPRTTEHHFELVQDFDHIVVSLDDIGRDDIWLKWLTGLDVVYSVETSYYPNAFDIARSVGCKFVLHVNFELNPYPKLHPEWPKPDVFAMPTVWHLDDVPGAILLPFPVDRDVFKYRRRERAESFVHVVGYRAFHDRNGTVTLAQAIPSITAPCQLVIRAQEVGSVGVRLRPPKHVELKVVEENLADPYNLYNSHDVMVMPRRYGGLCLPLAEATSCGLPTLMTDAPPQNTWLPADCLIASNVSTVNTMAGALKSYNANPRILAQMIDRYVREPGLVGRMSDAVDAYATSISWDTLLPYYRQFFESVAAGDIP